MIVSSKKKSLTVAIRFNRTLKDFAIGNEDRATLKDARFVFRKHFFDHVANLNECKVQNSTIKVYHYLKGL